MTKEAVNGSEPNAGVDRDDRATNFTVASGVNNYAVQLVDSPFLPT